MIYFIGGDFDAVKIGYSKHGIGSRLIALQGANPYKLHVLAACEGNKEQEAYLHDYFAEDRLNGEWFKRSSELDQLIERINREGSSPLNDSRRLVFYLGPKLLKALKHKCVEDKRTLSSAMNELVEKWLEDS
jgi:hypothetical protein